MRFFTKELWHAQTQQADNVAIAALLKKRNAAYKKELAKVLKKLDVKTRQFLRDDSLNQSCVDWFHYEFQNTKGIPNGNVLMSVEDARGNNFPLVYVNVARFQAELPGDAPLSAGPALGLLKYNELTLAKKNLRHEILFASGATILIECATIKLLPRPARKDTR